LEPARRIAEEKNAEVYLLSLADLPPDPTIKTNVDGRDIQYDAGLMLEHEEVRAPLDLLDHLDAPAHEENRARLAAQEEVRLYNYLEGKASFFGDRPVNINVAFSDDAADQIIGWAKDHDIDLIVMATHGRSGLSKLIRGSVASEVADSGVAPVVLVRPNGETEFHDVTSEQTTFT
jgi:nucleotide-binding universal stress UspA family protein